MAVEEYTAWIFQLGHSQREVLQMRSFGADNDEQARLKAVMWAQVRAAEEGWTKPWLELVRTGQGLIEETLITRPIGNSAAPSGV